MRNSAAKTESDIHGKVTKPNSKMLRMAHSSVALHGIKEPAGRTWKG